MPRYPFAASLAVALLIVSSCGGSDQASTTPTSTDTDMTSTTATTPTTAPYRSEVYADPTRWLCRPDRTDDFCDVDLSATVIAADGSTSIEPFEPADNAPIDCFYLYPTISDDPGINSDLDANQSEGSTARVQAGRFASVCRIFAPVYRSITLAGLFGGQATPEAREVAFADVVDAWKHYLANDNDGRGVVLIGHSQGASSLRRLASEVIEPDDAQRDLLVSALFLGSAVRIPDATATVGGDFAKIPVCTSSDETGCIVTYATFDAASPPPENTRFGKPRDGDGVAACTNPAALGGGSAKLTSYHLAGSVVPRLSIQPQVTTPFVKFESWIDAECREANGVRWLQVTFPTGNDIRPDGYDNVPDASWGLHIDDVNIAMGSLIELVRSQTAAYLDQ